MEIIFRENIKRIKQETLDCENKKKIRHDKELENLDLWIQSKMSVGGDGFSCPEANEELVSKENSRQTLLVEKELAWRLKS